MKGKPSAGLIIKIKVLKPIFANENLLPSREITFLLLFSILFLPLLFSFLMTKQKNQQSPATEWKKLHNIWSKANAFLSIITKPFAFFSFVSSPKVKIFSLGSVNTFLNFVPRSLLLLLLLKYTRWEVQSAKQIIASRYC